MGRKYSLRTNLTQNFKLLAFGLNFLLKFITFLFTFQCEIIFAHEYPNNFFFMHEYISIITHDNPIYNHSWISTVNEKLICWLQQFMDLSRP